MAHSKTIAGLIGPSLIALAAALLINLGSMSTLVEAVSRDPAILLVSGVLAFVAGLAVGEAVVFLVIGAFLSYKAHMRS
jgi:hypothetical protein